MRYAGKMLAVFYISVSVFSILFLSGCHHWPWRGRDHHRNDHERGERGDRDRHEHHEENRGGHPGD